MKPFLQSPAPAELSQPIGATLEAQRQEYMERLEQQLVEQQMRAMQARNGGHLHRNGHGNGHFDASADGDSFPSNTPIVDTDQVISSCRRIGSLVGLFPLLSN